MKTFVCSDLHLEFFPSLRDHKKIIASFPDVEAIIVAGDLSTKSSIEQDINLLCDKYSSVFFVAGNHEFYGSSFVDIFKKLNRLERVLPAFHWLEGGKFENIIGGTLWFADEDLNQIYEKSLSDFSYIQDFRQNVYQYNKLSASFLREEVNESSVVITHHLPSYLSVAEAHQTSNLNRFFVCDMIKTIANQKPKIWIHGHTHSSCDYMLGDTRVLCNPRGYPHELNKDFKLDLIIDI